MIGKSLLAKYMLATMQKGLFEEVMTIIEKKYMDKNFRTQLKSKF